MNRVDVLITTNYTKFLQDCLDSIPANDNLNIHLLFHNIKIEDVVHPNIKSVNEFSGKTLSEARMFLYRGVHKQTECVQFLDSDDTLKENYFEETLKYFNEYKEFDLFYTDYSCLNDEYTYPVFGTNTNLRLVKNPMLRVQGKKIINFDAKLNHDEYAPIYSQVGYENIFHIPKNLQTVREHTKMHSRSKR